MRSVSSLTSWLVICLFWLLTSLQGYLFARENTAKIERAQAWKEKTKKTLLYTETHRAYYKGGKIERSENQYFGPEGKLIATLNCDYSRKTELPEYIFVDLRTGYREGLRYERDSYAAFYQKQGQSEESEKIDDTTGLFSGQGWHYFLSNNLPKPNDNPLQMRLLFPSRLDDFRFRIRVMGSTEGTVRLRLEFDSWIMRMFTPHLDLSYDKKSGKLLSFYGPSNLEDTEGNTQIVWIYYE